MSGDLIAVEATATMARRDGGQLAAMAAREGGLVRGSWLLCRCGTHLHAIPIEHVIEIMRVLPIETVAGAPRYVCGLCVIRGVPVPVVDIGLLVGGEPTRLERLVTIRTGSRTIALAAEAVVGIQTFGADTLSRLPPLLRDAVSGAVDAIGTCDAELLFFLRAARIVPPDVLDRLDINGASASEASS